MDDKTAYVQKYINKMKKIQEIIIEFIDKDDFNEQFTYELNKYLDQEKVKENPYEIKLLLHIISQISTYHHRTQNFFVKINKILLLLKEDIKKNFSNYEIVNIFKFCLPVSVFLYDEKIIIPEISTCYSYNSYQYYFNFLIPEFKSFFSESDIKNFQYSSTLEEMETNSFKEKRRIGENDSYICQLIRSDSVKEFISYVNQSNISISEATINPSFYETNDLLIGNKQISLIEYATFFGSIQIFNYLRLNGVKLMPKLWMFAIHSNNPELIHLLEEFLIKPNVKEYNKYLKESIKCNHNDIANYIQTNLLNNNSNSNQRLQFFNFSVFSKIVDDNFDFLNDKNKRQTFFYDLCSNDCYELVVYFLNNFDVNINARTILNHVFFNIILINLYLYNSLDHILIMILLEF